MKSFLRFAFLSGCGWLLDCSLLLVLSRLGLALSLANIASSMTAALAVFLVSRFVVFDSRESPALSRAAIYAAYQVIGIFVASLLIVPAAALGVALAKASGLLVPTPWPAFLGKVIITPPQLVANFMISRYLIQYFRQSRRAT